MRINHQVMTEEQKNEFGNYVPNMESLKANATCKEEVEYLEEVERRWEEYKSKGFGEFVGFAFEIVYVAKQKCGHFEIFQMPLCCRDTFEEEAREMSEKRRCTSCTCSSLDFTKK